MALGTSSVRTTVAEFLSDDPTDFEFEPDEVREIQTGRWYGVTVFALLALGFGVLLQQPGLLLASAVGIAFAGYGQMTTPPRVELSLARSVSDHEADPGDAVTVTVTVRNDSDQTLPDLRLVDGVPSQLTVDDGTPRHATALRPGQETTYSYTVTLCRGDHEFQPMTVIARDASGATERVTSVATDTSVTCTPSLPDAKLSFPLRPQTSQYTGRFPADSGGPGVEFYATREYRRGDPLSRIDWNRTARTGEFTTVEYRVERTVTVVLLIDARAVAYRASEPTDRSAVDQSVDAAAQVYGSLTSDGHAVGVAAISPEACWLAPGNGSNHHVEARALFGTNPALSPTPTTEDTNIYAAVQELKGRLPNDAQVVLFSPLCDDLVLDSAVRLDAHGYPMTVVSPDPTGDDTTGQHIASVRRSLRIADLRRRGIPVIDWNGDDDFDRTIAGTLRRWSK